MTNENQVAQTQQQIFDPERQAGIASKTMNTACFIYNNTVEIMVKEFNALKIECEKERSEKEAVKKELAELKAKQPT